MRKYENFFLPARHINSHQEEVKIVKTSSNEKCDRCMFIFCSLSLANRP